MILSSKEALERMASKKRMVHQNDQANESDIDKSPPIKKVDVDIYLKDERSSSEDQSYLENELYQEDFNEIINIEA